MRQCNKDRAITGLCMIRVLRWSKSAQGPRACPKVMLKAAAEGCGRGNPPEFSPFRRPLQLGLGRGRRPCITANFLLPALPATSRKLTRRGGGCWVVGGAINSFYGRRHGVPHGAPPYESRFCSLLCVQLQALKL